jgi:hypothetical protein
MSQEDADKFVADLNKPLGTSSPGVPDDQFDDSYNQIKQQ